MTPTRARAVLPLVLAGLAGLPACTVGPDYAAPKPEMPAQWASPPEGGVTGGPAELTGWWTTLNDPVLSALVDRSVRNSPDLRQAAARVLEARAILGVVSADRLPTVDANGNYERFRNSNNAGGQLGGGRFQPTEGQDSFRVGLDASWELDVWGRIRRSVEAADADLGAAVEDQRDVLVTLVADVARSYVDLRAAQKRLAIAEENVRIQRDTLGLSEARFQAGLSSELDVARARAQLATTLSNIPPIQADVRTSIYRLAVLMGEQPGALVAELTPVAPLPSAPSAVATGLPAELLRRRPDVRRAERNLAAATARIGVAEADLYPRFSLAGSLGLAATQFGDVFQGSSRFWSIGPGVTFNLFDRRRIRNNITAAGARTEQAVAAFDAAVLRALEDVEAALVNYAREQDRLRALDEAVAANQRSVELATQLYARGLTDFFSVLDTQGRLFASQDQQILSQQQVTQNAVTLFRALGGGWDPAEPGGSRAFDPPAPASTESPAPAPPSPVAPAAG